LRILSAIPSWHLVPDPDKIKRLHRASEPWLCHNRNAASEFGITIDPVRGTPILLTRQQMQEDLSLAYLRAVVARVGMTYDLPTRDFGIDGTISRIARKHGRLVPSGVRLDVQLKSSINASVENDHVTYELEIRAYEVLRDDTAESPRILVLLVLPKDEREWIEQDEEGLIMRKCAYWISLRRHPETANNRSITIRIPRRNLFGTENLRDIMDTINQGGAL
jgi:Domain of unknown function (DUF4365)